MGNPSATLSASEARHLLRRAGFGATQRKISKFTGVRRDVAADRLLNFKTKWKPVGRDIGDKLHSWVKHMMATRVPLREKLVLFWHDHFASSAAKVAARFMGNQNFLLRKYCKGNFKDFVKAINKDPAMLEFLDTVRNHKDIPNENYARELQELFTLGVKDLNGQNNYEQADIVQIARAFTGWTYDYDKATPYFASYDHDYDEEFHDTRGDKVIYKTKGGFLPAGTGRSFIGNGGEFEGEAEIDVVIDIIFDHKDSQGYNTVARHIAYKLLSYFAYPNPTAALVNEVVGDSGFDTNFDISKLVNAIFINDRFYDTAAPAPFDASTKKSVKWPVDYVVSTLRMLKMKVGKKYSEVKGGSYRSLHDHLEDMGQHLFEPPSVFGWDWETRWLSSATSLARYTFARDIGGARGIGLTALRPQKLKEGLLNLTDGGDIVDAITDLLGVKDQLTGAERDVLINYVTDNSPATPVDLTIEYVRNMKLNGLITLVLQSFAYQLH